MKLDTTYIRALRKGMIDYSNKRRDVIKETGDALHTAKRCIFALHRENKKEAQEKLQSTETILKKLNTKYKKNQKLLEEGSYKAAVEEFVEAILFFQFVDSGKVGKINSIPVSPEIYVAGLCDLPGELYRYAIRAATVRDTDMVKKCAELSNEIVGELIEFNLTSYLRNKFDQAKQANKKLEQVMYELSLRG